jgi:hypothetical protein
MCFFGVGWSFAIHPCCELDNQCSCSKGSDPRHHLCCLGLCRSLCLYVVCVFTQPLKHSLPPRQSRSLTLASNSNKQNQISTQQLNKQISTQQLSQRECLAKGIGAFVNDRNALSIHTTVSLVLFGISVHDCILVSFQAERQRKRVDRNRHATSSLYQSYTHTVALDPARSLTHT